VASKNAVEEYLEKRAGFLGGLGEGAREVFTGIGPSALYEARGASPIDAMGAMRGAGRMAGKGLAGSAATVAGAGIASLGVLAVQKAYDAATKARDFKSMLEYAPDVLQMHQENPKQVSQMFSTLRVFNPDFTRDPVVASSYVRRMVSEPGGAGGIANEALQSRDKMRHPLADKMVGSALGGGKKKE
jgi:hypothetical protein